VTVSVRQLRDLIVADPDDLGLRRVYADLLVERGDPRGEFVHAQLALDGAVGDRRAELLELCERLLERHFAQWVAPLPASRADVRFVRGFVEVWGCDAATFAARGARAVRKTPLKRVVLSNVQQLPHLLQMPALRGLHELELRDLRVWPFRLLALSKPFLRLERLALEGQPWNRSDSLAGLVAQPWFQRVSSLELDLPLGPEDADVLEQTLPRLVELKVRDWVPVGHAPLLERLDVVHNDGPRLGPLLGLAPRLRHLSVSRSELGATFVRDVSRTALRRLVLTDCKISMADRAALRERFGAGLEESPVPAPLMGFQRLWAALAG
jgi:uncharacterized protein (TIGR02996 family)